MPVKKGNDLAVNIDRVRKQLTGAANRIDQALMQLTILEHDEQEREYVSAHQETHDDDSERGSVSATG